MRNAVGIFGLFCGAIVVALVARYGYKTTDVEMDALIMAFLLGVIASFALFGHAVAVRLWSRSKLWSIAAGIVAVCALALNLSNSLGAIAGRADTTQTAAIERNRQIRAADAEIKRLQAQRDAMPPFSYADAAAVAAAQRLADAATKSREAECRQRGNWCRDREADERKAASDLADASRNRAASERAAKLEAQIEEERTKLAKMGPMASVNVQGNALARLFRLPDTEAGFIASAQQFGTAAIVELIILICFVSWEIMGRNVPAGSTRKAGHVEEIEKRRHQAVGIEPLLVPAPAPVTLASLSAPPPRPKLVASSETPKGSVRIILGEHLEAAKGKKVEIEALGKRYLAVCKAQGKRSVSMAEFISEVEQFCSALGLNRREIRGQVFVMDVDLIDANVLTADR